LNWGERKVATIRNPEEKIRGKVFKKTKLTEIYKLLLLICEEL